MKSKDKPTSRTALVLAGGGALGAYEAGVMRYILDTLSHDGSPSPSFEVFAGTSVGALNASFLAASAHLPGYGVRQLVQYWESITFDRIMRFGREELATMVWLGLGGWLRGSGVPAEHLPGSTRAPHPPVAGIFDVSPLYEDMRSLIPWQRLPRNMSEGLVDGLALCATEVCTGVSTIFYQTGPEVLYRTGRYPNKISRQVSIGVEHAMASAAIPFLFPSVQVDGICYTDGALRQNTPLNPALRMGADRVLVISLTQDPLDAHRHARIGCRRNPFPGALFMLGTTVHVLLTATLDYELSRVEMYNRLIQGGKETYGEGFVDELNRIMGSQRNADYRPVRTCHIRPTRNLTHLAVQCNQAAPGELRLRGGPGRIISALMGSNAIRESDLLSFLMFTPTYIAALLKLGYEDAEAMHDELVAFFNA